MGKTVRLGNDDYTVIGVLETSSFMGGGGTFYAPYTTVETRIGNASGIQQIVGFAREGTDMDRLVETTQTFVAQYFNLEPENVAAVARRRHQADGNDDDVVRCSWARSRPSRCSWAASAS